MFKLKGFTQLLLQSTPIFTVQSLFSLHPAKHIAVGEGGIITTDNLDLYEKLTKYEISFSRYLGFEPDDINQKICFHFDFQVDFDFWFIIPMFQNS